MTQAEYARVTSELQALAKSIEDSKRPGYTVGSEDVLANFKRVAERSGLTAEQVWTVYFLKHVDAIVAFLSKPDLPVSEAPQGRFADALNYIRLGYALWRERSGGDASSSVSRPPTSDKWPTDATPERFSSAARSVSSGGATHVERPIVTCAVPD